MAGTFNESLLRAVAFDQVRAWLAGSTGNDGLPAKPRIGELDRVTVNSDVTTSGVPLQVTSVVTTGGPVVDISAAALTTGKALDISNLDAITTGKAIHVDATGVTQTTGVLVHVDSAATGLTGAGRLLLVDHTGITTTSGVITEVKSAANDETVVAQILASAALAGGKLLNLSAAAMTTGTGIDLSNADALTSGKLANLQSTGEALTSGILLDVGHIGNGSNADVTGNIAKFASSITDTDTSGTAAEDYDTVLISRTDVMNGAGGTLDADGALLKLESTATQTAGTLTHDVIGVEMALNSFSASDVYAIKITNDNAGAGNPGGVDLSTFAVDEPLLKAPADAITAVGTISQQIAIDIGGTIYYLVAYTHGT